MTEKTTKKLDFSEFDLRKLDLMRKYDDDFSSADGIAWRDHILLYAIAGLMLIFLIWANLATLDEVARGDGRVIPSSEVQVIQNLEGGIIEEILVKEGDTVQEGQTLLRIHNIQAKSDYAATTQRYLGLLAATIRLQAEANNNSDPVFPAEIIEGAPETARAEQDAFQANKKNSEGQLAVLDQQKTQKEQEMAELSRKISDTAKILKLAKDERAMVAPMVEKGSASKMELLQLDRQIAQQTAEMNGLKLSLPRAQSAVSEISERITGLTSGTRAQAQKELAEKTAELNTIRQTLDTYKDRSERTDVKSPVHGLIKDIKVTTVGGVAKPGEPIMEIVPLEDVLVVEGRINPSDIAFIHQGDRAIIRLSAFDFSVYGSLDGKVTEISGDSIVNEKGESFYRVRVKTDKTSLKKDGKDYAIIPGMQATVDIVTGRKTVMGYLLKPFNKAAQTALRER